MTGFLTMKRYKYATLYMDQYTQYGYVYLQKTASAEETVEGKRLLKQWHGAMASGLKITTPTRGSSKRTSGPKLACKEEKQGITFAGVNAYHQNCVAERRMRELQELARAMLIHANSRWKDSVTANLWPYAVRMASNAVNHTPSFQDEGRRTPTEMLSGSKVSSNPKHWKPFGCPAYVLDNSLQGQNPFHKWKQRAKPGIYIGKVSH